MAEQHTYFVGIGHGMFVLVHNISISGMWESVKSAAGTVAQGAVNGALNLAARAAGGVDAALGAVSAMLDQAGGITTLPVKDAGPKGALVEGVQATTSAARGVAQQVGETASAQVAPLIGPDGKVTLPVLAAERLQATIENLPEFMPGGAGYPGMAGSETGKALVGDFLATWENTGEAGFSTAGRVAVSVGAAADKLVGTEGLLTAWEGKDRSGRELTPAARAVVGTEAAVQVVGTALAIKGVGAAALETPAGQRAVGTLKRLHGDEYGGVKYPLLRSAEG